MKFLSHLFRLTFLAALLAATALSAKPVTQAHAGNIITVNTEQPSHQVDDGICGLEEAIYSANADNPAFIDCGRGNGDDTIDFADDVHVITLDYSLPTITKDLMIDGGGDVTIHGDYNYRLFTVGATTSVTLRGLTLSGGYVAPQYGGGAILNQGTLTVLNSVFYFNQAGWG